jgi:hypothetical protein
MVLHRFGALEIDVPTQWSDQSTITFVRDQSKPPSKLRENFVITRAPFDGSYTLEDLARAHLDGLRAQVPGVSVASEEKIEIDGLPAIAREVRFPTPQHGTAQQLHVFHIRGDLAYTMVGIGSAGPAFERTRDELFAIVKSLKVRRT